MFRRKPKRAAVLGCGPAGLFAAHALVDAGWDVTVYSNRRRSEMFGAQYLHAPVPGLAEIGTVIHYRLQGSVVAYRDKVYEGMPVESVSPESLAGYHRAWDIRAAYYDAWERYQSLIKHTPGIGAADVEDLRGKGFRLIVSSLPAPSICMGLHRFQSQKVWASGDAPERGKMCPVETPADTVICNGDPAPSWYRASNVFGYNTCEWPGGTKPPLDVAEVIKPIKTDCDCQPGVLRIGRYGTWTKGVLSHEAYTTVRKAI